MTAGSREHIMNTPSTDLKIHPCRLRQKLGSGVYPLMVVLLFAAGKVLAAQDAASPGAAGLQTNEHVHSELPADDGAAAAEHQHAHAADEGPTESELAHVPPAPAENPLGELSRERMIELMEMEDDAPFGRVLVDRLEWYEIEAKDAVHSEADAWYGNDYDKAWLKIEGDAIAGDATGSAELLWDRIIARWWSVQAGVRVDDGNARDRTWAALGIQGLAPYFFEVEATAYVSSEGRAAFELSAEYELLFTQRLILQPEFSVKFHGKDDPENGIGSGVTSGELGLRLRYELQREFAPYVGVVWAHQFGETADITRVAGGDAHDVQLRAGIRVWL